MRTKILITLDIGASERQTTNGETGITTEKMTNVPSNSASSPSPHHRFASAHALISHTLRCATSTIATSLHLITPSSSSISSSFIFISSTQTLLNGLPNPAFRHSALQNASSSVRDAKSYKERRVVQVRERERWEEREVVGWWWW